MCGFFIGREETMGDVEKRSFGIFARSSKDVRQIEMYPAVFDKLSEDLGGFREKIKPGAFKGAIGRDDVRATLNHDPNYVFGRNKSGTLTLEEDKNGLRAVIDPPDSQWVRDILQNIDRGDIDQGSFVFRTIKDKWETIDGEEIRTLEDVQLIDVSIVTYPAYPDTTIAKRSLHEWRKDEPNGDIKTPMRSDGGSDSESAEVPMYRNAHLRKYSQLKLKKTTEELQ